MKVPYEWLGEYVEIGCSPEELCERLTALGFESAVFGEKCGYTVLDVEIFSNRPDCLSLIGIAREVAAQEGKDVKYPWKREEEAAGDSGDVTVRIETEMCPRYCAKIIRGVNAGASPKWMAERLEAAGIRAINNIVDATNYCLIEMGHPLHAFDMDRIKGGEIIVRTARAGEKITTLDGTERVLEPWMMVIADAEKPVALAGIMGGEDSEVGNNTKDILLEGAFFSPSSVRKTAKRLQIETEASYRFQRGADMEGILTALGRAACLIQEVAGGTSGGSAVDVRTAGREAREAELSLQRMNRILGTDVKEDFVREKLGSLGFQVSAAEGIIKVGIPSYRMDAGREIDLIEEIARFYGYENIPERLPAGEIPLSLGAMKRDLNSEIRAILTGYGLYEALNHSLLGEKEASVCSPGCRFARVSNPLSEEQAVMRASLMPGLLQNAATNMRRGCGDVRLFETGGVFLNGGGKVIERLSLAAVISGSTEPHWMVEPEEYGFFHLKGLLGGLFESLNFETPALEPCEAGALAEGEGCFVELSGRKCGTIGRVAEGIAAHFGIDIPVFVFELDLSELEASSDGRRMFAPLPKYPASFRDIALVVPENVKSSDIVSLMRRVGGDIVENIEIFDVYRGEQVPSGRKSMAYSIVYRSGERTLTDEEVDMKHAEIAGRAAEEFGGFLREK